MTTTTGSAIDHTIGAEGVLVVSLRSGTVRLRATDGDAVRILDAAGGDLSAACAIELGQGSVAIRANSGFDIGGRGWRAGGVDLEIDLPRRATVVLDGTSAEIEAKGLSGEQQYKTVSGGVTLRGVSGRIRIEAVSGDIDITADAEAALTARTISGDLDLRAGTLSGLDVTTTSGDLKVAGRLAGSGPFRVQTVSGDGLLAPVGDLRIEMTTVTGDLRSDIGGTPGGGRGRRSLAVGENGPLVSFRSMSGDLRVVRAIPVSGHGREPVAAPEPIALIEADPEAAAAGSPSAHAPAVIERDDTERVPIDVAAPADSAEAASVTDVTDEEGDRIAILRLLERGEIDVAEAGRRLESLERVDGPADDTSRPGGGAPRG